MKNKAKHIIHKLTLDIRFQDFDTSHKWITATQAKTSEAMRRSIEQCLEDNDYTNDYLTIEKLEFDLGVFATNELLSKMPERLFSELQKILSSFRLDLNDFEETEIIEDVSSMSIWLDSVADNRIVNPIVKKSEVTALLFFLQHGYLPWWYSNEPAWNPEWVQKLSEENWRELRYFLTTNPENEVDYERALSRLISQFSDGFLASLLNGLQLKEPVEKAWNWLTRFYETLQKAESDYFRNESSLPSFSIFRRHFWKQWIRYAVGKSAIPELATLFALIKQPSLITYFLSEIAENNEWMDSLPQFWHSELKSLKQKEHKYKTELRVRSEFVNYEETEKFKELEKASHTDKATHTEKEDFILIPDSGLVLLHPFLPRLFEYCGWLNENKFLNDEARTRAIKTLHYLAAGNEDAPEFVLMLPKLLCGIPLRWPPEPVLPLTDAEKASCDEMLIQVISHWTALRNTSPAGLRETFLRRQGKLFVTDERWRLEVQRKTEDILLNRLPWGFSIIKFSWMPLPLSVSWE
ncbi:MAG: contractile injection system tape measure protein [Cyclobacteriaceae bacterium]